MINKMKIMGKNSIFGLRVQIRMTDECIVGIAIGTAFTLKALPIPTPIDFKVNKYFRQREEKQTFDLLGPVLEMANRNIEMNFKMPIFKVQGQNYVHNEECLLPSMDQRSTGGEDTPVPAMSIHNQPPESPTPNEMNKVKTESVMDIIK